MGLGLPRRHIPFPEVGPGTLWYQKTRKVMGVVPLPLPPCTYLPPSCDVGVRVSYTTITPYAHRVSLGPYAYSPRSGLGPWRCR